MVRRPTFPDVLYGAVVLTATVLLARVWWLSAILPAMDYSQFLVFVRAVQDIGDPASPFHGTYSTGLWLMPAALPVHVTSWLSHATGHSLEAAGKVLLTAQTVGLIAASVYLLRVLGRTRWAIVLLLPLVHSRWTVVGGYIVYATSLPLVVLGWALAVRWLRKLSWGSGVPLALCLSITLCWHGIGYVVAGLGFAALWCAWRAGSWGERLLSVTPTLPSLLHYALWMSTTFGKPSGPATPPSWSHPLDAADSVTEYVWASVPHSHGLALGLAALVGAGLVLDRTARWATGETARMWRTDNPFLVLSLVYLAAYFLLPAQWNHVEGVSTRFAYPAALAFVFAWNLPEGRLARGVVLASVLAFGAFCSSDLTERFRAFDRDTRGASTLMDRVEPRATLYHYPPDRGASRDFAAGHVPLRELQQIVTIRGGGLPNSSFAGYGYNYVSYVGGKNPMPGLTGPPRYSPEMTRFDYVLSRAGQGPGDPRFRLVDTAPGWELYGVCGSARFPACS